VQVGERLSKLVGDERVEERIEAAVDVEEESRDWRDVHLDIRVIDRVAPLLPLDAQVMRQHADGERGNDGGQQTNYLASGRQRILVGCHLSGAALIDARTRRRVSSAGTGRVQLGGEAATASASARGRDLHAVSVQRHQRRAAEGASSLHRVQVGRVRLRAGDEQTIAGGVQSGVSAVRVLGELETGERQRQNGVGAPENDGDLDVDEGHEDEWRDVEEREVEDGVDASVERQCVEAVDGVSAGRDDVVGDQPRQGVEDAHEPRAADEQAVKGSHSSETTIQHRVLDGDVPLERYERQNEDRTAVGKVLDEVEQLAYHLNT